MIREVTTADAIEAALVSHDADGGEPANVVDGLFAIAYALHGLTRAVQALGNGDASTPYGAVEALSMQVKEGLDSIATNTYEGLGMIATAVESARE